MGLSIDVSVLDGKYDNYQLEIITFLVCCYDDFDENSQWLPFETIKIPVTSYYDTRIKNLHYMDGRDLLHPAKLQCPQQTVEQRQIVL